MYYIHPTECIECGMCESICPVDAIRYADEVEDAEQPFVALNVDVFRDCDGNLQEPGGWSKKHPPLKDPKNLQAITDQVLQELKRNKPA